MFELIRQLVNLYGATGREAGVADAVEALVKDHVDSIRRDALGNLICEKRGTDPDGSSWIKMALLSAYAGSCAITGTDVREVLQAAHINPYRGKRSQVVNNGILLRADMHLLYDAHLVSVDPDSLELRMSERLGASDYLRYNKVALRSPDNPKLAPSRDLLAIHYEQFRRENPALVA